MSMSVRTRSMLTAGAAAVVLAGTPILFAGGSSAHPDCDRVHGLFEDHLVTPPPALTTEGRVLGSLRGDLHFALVNETPSATPNVSFYDARSSIHTDDGDLFFDEAGSTDGANGNLTALQTITGGSGRFQGATGQLFAHGNFNFATLQGQGEYEGTVCTK
jgi:hypothetical protein